jgi:hypothetical protein
MANPLESREWQEARAAMGRWDQTVADLRKYGFGLVTILITASAFLAHTTTTTPALSPLEHVAVVIAISILITALFFVDRFFVILQNGAAQRAVELEGATWNLAAFEWAQSYTAEVAPEFDVNTEPPAHRAGVQYLTELINLYFAGSYAALIAPILYFSLLVAAAILGWVTLVQAETELPTSAEQAQRVLGQVSDAKILLEWAIAGASVLMLSYLVLTEALFRTNRRKARTYFLTDVQGHDVSETMHKRARVDVMAVWSFSLYSKRGKDYFASTLRISTGSHVRTHRIIDVDSISPETIFDHIWECRSHIASGAYCIYVAKYIGYEMLIMDKSYAALFFQGSVDPQAGTSGGFRYLWSDYNSPVNVRHITDDLFRPILSRAVRFDMSQFDAKKFSLPAPDPATRAAVVAWLREQATKT